MTRILYLSPDLDDPATWRRVGMLEAGGAVVEVVGFRRSTGPLPREATVLGQTFNGRFLHRALSALRLAITGRALRGTQTPDVILARNLEMLPLARRAKGLMRGRGAPRLVYEVLDIHRLLVGPGPVQSLVRFVERRLCRGVDGVLVSSMRFETEHFRRYRQTSAPTMLVENKVWNPDATELAVPTTRAARRDGDAIVIGWFGVLRCAQSLRCLDAVCRQAEGRVRLVLRGRPALDVLPDFHRIVDANPHIEFHGPYRYPDDLARIYGEIDVAWLVDRFDKGANSDWLLPNRLYEGCANGAVPIALAGTEVGDYLTRHRIGPALSDLRPDAVASLLSELDTDQLGLLRARILAAGASAWRTTPQDCIHLVDRLTGRTESIGDVATAPDLVWREAAE